MAKSMNSIKSNILRNILFFACIILITFSLFLSIFIYHIKMNDAKIIIKEKNESIILSINTLFIKIKNYIEFLSSDKKIINLSSLPPYVTKEILSKYKNLKKIDSDIRYIYSGYENGKLFINNYIPPLGYDPRIRPWYKAALKAAPNISTIPYREIKSNEWLVSFSKILRNKRNKITGVLVIDISLSKIINLLEKSKIINCFILNKKGNIIIYKDTSYLNKNYKKINVNSGNKLTYLHPIKDLGWTVVTEIDKNRIFSPIIYQILICNLSVLIIAFTFAWGLSFSFTRTFVQPIEKLKDRVESIIENKFYEKEQYKYPKNEIGLIAEKIEHLTQHELYKKNKKLTELSQTDQLTGLYNRRYILRALNEELVRAKRYKSVFSIILFDIDHFKGINDVFGHNAGDEVLKSISKLSINLIRNTDKLARWGGEEFLILCIETSGEEAKLLAEKLRRAIERYNFSINRKVTISGGVAQYDNEDDIKDLIAKADTKLYQAKNSGRNKIII